MNTRFTFGAIFFLFYSVCLVGDLIIRLLRFFFFLQILRIMFFVHILVFLAVLVFVAVLMLFLVFVRFLVFFVIARLGCFALHDFLRLALRRFSRANCNEHEKNQNNAQPHRGIDARRSNANLTRCEKLLGLLRLTTPAVRARALQSLLRYEKSLKFMNYICFLLHVNFFQLIHSKYLLKMLRSFKK